MTVASKDKDLPVVSIVIPAYNHARYLPEAINSVLAQDYSRVELIVIDDGSTDNTAEILAGMDDNFYRETQGNIGQSGTLTKGWKIARGDILGYLSADDILNPGAVSTSVKALMAMPDAVASYCDFNLIDPQSRRVRKVELPDYSYDDMLAKVSCPVGPGAFFRRSAYLKAGAWNPAYQQMPDYDFWLRLGLLGDFIHIPQVLAGFRVHEKSLTYSVSSRERAAEPVTIVASLLEQAAAREFDIRLRNRAMASANLVSAQLHLRAGRFAEARHSICHAWRYSGSTVLAPRTLRLLVNAAINRTMHRVLWTIRGNKNTQRE